MPNSLELPRAEAHALLCRVLAELDDDCDRRITVNDEVAPTRRSGIDDPATSEARWPHRAVAADASITLPAPHAAAQLVQELVVGLRTSGSKPVRLDLTRV